MICVINHKKVTNLVHKLAHCRMSTILSLYYGYDQGYDFDVTGQGPTTPLIFETSLKCK